MSIVQTSMQLPAVPPSDALGRQPGIEHAWMFDGLSAAILVLAPLFMGGRHPLGRLVYVVSVSLLALLWLARCARLRQFRYRSCGLEWVILLASGLVVLQLLPLPPPLLERLSPRLAFYLPLWNSASSPGSPDLGWQTLSVTPSNTRIGLTVWGAHVLFLVMLIQRLQTRAELRRVVGCVAVAGVGLAAVGMLQYLFSNGKFLWLYQDPYRGTRDVVRGPFYNENHFAHLLSLTLVPLWIWLRSLRANHQAVRERFTLHRERRGELRLLLLTAAWPSVLFTILLTRSRGGVIAALVAVALGAMGIVCRDGWRRSQALRMGAVMGALLLALSIHGLDQVGREVESLATTSLDTLDERAGRRKIWRTAREVLGQFTLCGAGVGSFRETFPLFYAEPREFDYSYAESGFLQVAVETGLLGTALLLVALAFAARIQWSFWRRFPEANDGEWGLAAAVGLGVSLVHSIFDFVWYLPACFATTLALMAVLIRYQALERPARDSRPGSHCREQVIGIAVISMASLIVLSGIKPLLAAARANGPWNAFRLAALELQTAPDERPTDPSEPLLLSLQTHLAETVRRDPKHAQAHLRLATHSLQLFELRQLTNANPMSLAQIRDAALASRFESRAAQDRWLNAALGANRQLLDEALDHACTALKLSPLQGVGYVYLAELAFLELPDSSIHSQCVRQALRVRPYDPTVLFAAGREAIFTGNLTRAIVFWRRAYHQDSALRQRITFQLAPQLPAAVFIEHFEPDPSQLLTLLEFYRQHQMPQQAFAVAQTFLDRLDGLQPTTSLDSRRLESHLCRQGYTIAAELNDPRAVEIARRVVALNPHDYTMRRRLAFELLGQKSYRSAIEHLSRCQEMEPGDRVVAEKLQWARQQR